VIIFVPTRGRVGDQTTRKRFFLDYVPWTVVYVVPECEKHLWAIEDDIKVVPDDWGISNIRHAIVYDWKDYGDPHHLVMDDDLVFLRRVAPTNVKQRSDTTLGDAVECFERMESYLKDGFVHGAISIRSGNNRCPDVCAYNTRALNAHFYDAETLVGEGVRYDDVPVMQDFHMTLNLLELGYQNVVDYEFITGQQDHKPGGCSRYRTVEMIRRTIDQLAELHPGFVKLRVKEVKNPLAPQAELPDVTIYWKKAFGSRAHERKLNVATPCLPDDAGAE
jgi:hypothetical protein